MSCRKAVALASVCTLLGSGFAVAKPSVVLRRPAACVAPEGSFRVSAAITGGVVAARVLFRAEQATCSGNEYYVDMRRGTDGVHWAVLPVVAPETTLVSYRVWARGSDGSEMVTDLQTIRVDPGCPIPSWTTDEQGFARNIALGLTRADQNVEPCGFLCNGLVRLITIEGQMVPHQACAARLAAAASAGAVAGAGAAAAGGSAAAVGAAGLGAGAGILAGAGLVAGVIAVNQASEDKQQVSPSRP